MKSNGKKGNGKYYFDKEAAKRAVSFFETYLIHIKGEWAGQAFKLLRWQRKKIIEPIFGWKRADGTRKYRTAYIEVPSKNGKSSLASGIALYLLFADFEPGAEIYSAAGDRDQAAIVFELAKQMIEKSRALSRRCEIFKRSIFVPRWSASYKVLSADAYTKHGINAHGIIFDELHVQPNRDLWDTLKTMTGARRQPLTFAITTAGFDKKTICGEQHDYAEKVLKGTIEDETFFAFIAKAGDKAKWTEPKVWEKANPSLGITVSEDFLRAECYTAQQSPAYENTFRRLHLNQWTAQAIRWLPLDAWDSCDQGVDFKALAGRKCYAGLDLASTIDIAALVLVFPPVDEQEPFFVLPFFWIPKDEMRERSNRDKVPYEVWVKQGLIHATEGNVIDYGAIKNTIMELGKGQCTKCHHIHQYTDRPCVEADCNCPEPALFIPEPYSIEEVAFDRWGATAISKDLSDEEFLMVQFGQGFASMSPPTKELLKLTLSRKIAHGGNPVLRWMADNLVVKGDSAGNLKPDRQRSTEKIDGMVAMIMGLDRAIRKRGDDSDESPYDKRGLLSI
ncbi:MAG: terminase large subunit [Nitrospiria bacterium]